MSDTVNCPFCSVPSKPGSVDYGNQYLFKCPNCGTFLMYHAVHRQMVDRGEHSNRKAMLLEFIKQTPEDQIAYIGSNAKNGLYAEYRPFKQS